MQARFEFLPSRSTTGEPCNSQLLFTVSVVSIAYRASLFRRLSARALPSEEGDGFFWECVMIPE